MEGTFPTRSIGVTGFRSALELRLVHMLFHRIYREHLDTNKKGVRPPRLMTGILVSSKTLYGYSNWYLRRYPRPTALPDLCRQASSLETFNLVHYSTDTPECMVDDCIKVMRFTESLLKGIQFNLYWPNPAHLQMLRRRYPELYFLLQVGNRALDEFARGSSEESFRYDTRGFITRVKKYEGLIDGILLDPSGGRGRPLEPDRLAPLVKELQQYPRLDIGVAGGLSGNSMELIRDLADICPYLSIDAEGRLRNPEDDSLALMEVMSYLKAAFDLFYPKEG